MFSFPLLSPNNRLRVSNRSGKSVNSAAATSPMRPWVLVTLAMVMKPSSRMAVHRGVEHEFSSCPLWLAVLIFHNLQRVTLFQLHAGSAENGAAGLGCAAL